jgi:hypothetical protein
MCVSVQSCSPPSPARPARSHSQLHVSHPLVTHLRAKAAVKVPESASYSPVHAIQYVSALFSSLAH